MTDAIFLIYGSLKSQVLKAIGELRILPPPEFQRDPEAYAGDPSADSSCWFQDVSENRDLNEEDINCIEAAVFDYESQVLPQFWTEEDVYTATGSYRFTIEVEQTTDGSCRIDVAQFGLDEFNDPAFIGRNGYAMVANAAQAERYLTAYVDRAGGMQKALAPDSQGEMFLSHSIDAIDLVVLGEYTRQRGLSVLQVLECGTCA